MMREWATAFLIGMILGFMVTAFCWAKAAEKDPYEGLIPMWTICKAGSYVNVRSGPMRKAQELGRLEPAEQVWTDGKQKGAYVHVVGLTMESEEGWVHAGYLVKDEPEMLDGEFYRVCSNGRVALRRMVDGSRRAWAKSGAVLKVYVMSKEWALTNRGYIRTEFIEVFEESSET